MVRRRLKNAGGEPESGRQGVGLERWVGRRRARARPGPWRTAPELRITRVSARRAAVPDAGSGERRRQTPNRCAAG